MSVSCSLGPGPGALAPAEVLARHCMTCVTRARASAAPVGRWPGPLPRAPASLPLGLKPSLRPPHQPGWRGRAAVRPFMSRLCRSRCSLAGREPASETSIGE